MGTYQDLELAAEAKEFLAKLEQASPEFFLAFKAELALYSYAEPGPESGDELRVTVPALNAAFEALDSDLRFVESNNADLPGADVSFTFGSMAIALEEIIATGESLEIEADFISGGTGGPLTLLVAPEGGWIHSDSGPDIDEDEFADKGQSQSSSHELEGK